MQQRKTTIITLNVPNISRNDAANALLSLSETALQTPLSSRKSVTFDLSQNIVHEVAVSINQEPERQPKRKNQTDAPFNKRNRVTPSDEPYITQSGRVSPPPFKGRTRYR